MKIKKDFFSYLVKFLLKIVFFIGIIKLSSLFKLSFIFGSKFATFSGTSATLPVIGACAGGLVSFAIFAMFFVARCVIFGFSSWHVLAFYVPGLCAALYFSCKSIFIRLVLPVICIILFLVHPAGINAPVYAMLWLVPVIIYFKKSKNMFLECLASTFVAHAVGSVIFLYALGLSALTWNSLVLLVILERFAIALSMFVLYKLFNYVKSYNFVFCKKLAVGRSS